MTFITYIPQNRTVEPLSTDSGNGGFDLATKTLVAMTNIRELWLHQVLDTLTAAAEAGVLKEKEWAVQLFATEADFDAFIEELSTYDETFRLHDRWWEALHMLALEHYTEEEGFIACRDIADALVHCKRETGQAWA